MISYEELRKEVERRKRERWADILASEPPGRPVGRRPRDPDQERLLLRLDRARLARRKEREGIEVRRRASGGEHDDGEERAREE